MNADVYNQPLRIEIAPEARNSRVFLGDNDISQNVRGIHIDAQAGDLTAVILDCVQLTNGVKWTIEGVLIPVSDAKDYLIWKLEQLRGKA